ncbi:hypothetical protein Tco_1285398 [Tanacetum coccineum]
MAVLESCPKHNMVAYLEKTDGNTEFHEIISFLTRSSIHYALTVSPVVSTTFVEQFWMSAKSKLINNVRYITAKVAGKPVSISEASIRSDLLFNDADGIDSLPNQAIFDAIQLMGPSPTSHITDSIPEGSGGNHGGITDYHSKRVIMSEIMRSDIQIWGFHDRSLIKDEAKNKTQPDALNMMNEPQKDVRGLPCCLQSKWTFPGHSTIYLGDDIITCIRQDFIIMYSTWSIESYQVSHTGCELKLILWGDLQGNRHGNPHQKKIDSEQKDFWNSTKLGDCQMEII